MVVKKMENNTGIKKLNVLSPMETAHKLLKSIEHCLKLSILDHETNQSKERYGIDETGNNNHRISF